MMLDLPLAAYLLDPSRAIRHYYQRPLGSHEALGAPAFFALVDVMDKSGLLKLGARKPHCLTTLDAIWWIVQRLGLIHVRA